MIGNVRLDPAPYPPDLHTGHTWHQTTNSVHIGGSAHGYQGLSALLVISTTDEQQTAQAVCLCIASAARECALLPL